MERSIPTPTKRRSLLTLVLQWCYHDFAMVFSGVTVVLHSCYTGLKVVLQ
jgi:hypothetical protein